MDNSMFESWTMDKFPAGVPKERYEVKDTGDEGSYTMRAKFLVKCLDCNEVVHPCTTGPDFYIEMHEEQSHGRKPAR